MSRQRLDLQHVRPGHGLSEATRASGVMLLSGGVIQRARFSGLDFGPLLIAVNGSTSAETARNVNACTLALALACLGNPVEMPTSPTAEARGAETGKPRKPRLPRDGGPALVLGSLTLASAVAILLGGLLGPPDEYEPGASFSFVVMGGVGIPGGVAILASGVAARVKYVRTHPNHRDDPPTGRAMHMAGAFFLGAGATSAFVGSMLLHKYNTCVPCVGRPPREAWTMPLGLGVGSLLVGSALFIPSQIRGTRYRRWSMQPSFGAGPRGMQIGIAGRF